MWFPQEMPKVSNCLKCLKLRYSVAFKFKNASYAMKKFLINVISWDYHCPILNIDGAQRHYNFRHFSAF